MDLLIFPVTNNHRVMGSHLPLVINHFFGFIRVENKVVVTPDLKSSNLFVVH